MAATTRSPDLRKLLERLEVDKKVEAGYEIKGIFVTNRTRNTDAIDILKISPQIFLYDAIELDRQYLPIDKTEPIATPIRFSVSGVDVLEHQIEKKEDLKMIIAPIAASELVKMEGISNLELFRYNLRYEIKNSPVNRDIEASVVEPDEHRYFPAFHNGLTVLCETLELKRKKIRISGYAVVNGCQSLNALFHNEGKITPELRILTKFIQVSPNSKLAQKITDRTNNQNAIIGRDRQSSSDIQNRLQSEIHREYTGEVYYRIARGEHPEWDQKKVIENDQTARMLLAFNLKQPESCHQRYKLFNELHEDIFGHPDVNADRIVALDDVDRVILSKRSIMKNKSFAYYGLSRFLFHYLLREVLETDEAGRQFCQNPTEYVRQPDHRMRLAHSIEPIVAALMRLMDAYLTRNPNFDFKKDLKSPTKISDLRLFVVPQFQIAVDTEGAKAFSEQWQESERTFAVLNNPEVKQ
jgi:hypothetical protein